jgi:aspartate aminotransferase
MYADPSVLAEMITAFRKRRDLVLSLLKEIPGIRINNPGGAFYVFPDCSSFFGKKYENVSINNSDELCMYLLEHALVALVGGEAFGDPNCFRISYAASEETLIEAMKRIKVALEKLI